MKYNNKYTFLSIATLFLGFSMGCLAKEGNHSDLSCFFCDMKPHIGFNILQLRTKFKSGYGDNLFRKNLPAGEIYAGVSLNDHFGINVGYYSSSKKNRDASLETGDINLGRPIQVAASPTITASKSKIWGTFIDLEGSMPVETINLSLFASIGLEYSKIKLERCIVSFAGFIPAPELQNIDLSNSKGLLRINAGVNKNITSNLSVRALVGWKNMSRLKVNTTTNAGNFVEAKLKDNFHYGVGLQYNF